MKKISLLIALCMLLTIGGVYATWTYTQATDVADEAVNMNMNLTDVAYTGTYGTYQVDTSSLSMVIDPKEGTTHTTALYVTGQIVIKFTPNTYAPDNVKADAVPSTFALSVSSAEWKYEGTNIITVNHPGEKHDITWTPQGDGTFTYTIDAATLAGHLTLSEFSLDTKADYDAYNAALGQGSVVITVSDGFTATP